MDSQTGRELPADISDDADAVSSEDDSSGPRTILTSFMILSDTHGANFLSDQAVRSLQIPKVDVLLHCGDLTVTGQSVEFVNAIDMLSKFNAELKLVIAGNHDLSLDSEYEKHRGPGQYHFPPVGPNSNYQASEYMRCKMATKAGITYLEEGLHSFVLDSGAQFSIYASPHQPHYNGSSWGFSYPRDEDRFNPLHLVAPHMKPTAINPIPDYPRVDIIMTHGPPYGILDRTKEWQNVGCEALLGALIRAKPKLHCFGHIHEAMGAGIVMWKDQEEGLGKQLAGHYASAEDYIPCSNTYPQPLYKRIPVGKGTLMINASVQDGDAKYSWNNDPWIVQLQLEVYVPQFSSFVEIVRAGKELRALHDN